MFWETVRSLATNAMPWVVLGSGAVVIIGSLGGLFVRAIKKAFEAAAKKNRALIEGAVSEIKAVTVSKVDGAVSEIKAVTEAKVDGAQKENVAKIDGAVSEIKAVTEAKIDGAQKENVAKIDGAVKEFKAHIDGVENAREAKAEGEEKVQDEQIAHLKSVTEENRRDIRNLESFVYRDGKDFGGGESEPSPPAAE